MSSRRIGSVVIALFLSLAALGAQPATLQEVERLRQEARAASTGGKANEAAEAWEKAVTLARKVWADQPSMLEGVIEEAAKADRKRDDFERAAGRWEEIATSREQRLGSRHWQTLEAGLERDDVRRVQKLPQEVRRRLKAADDAFDKAMSLRNENRFAESVEVFETVLSERSAIHGADHRLTAEAHAWIGWSTNALKLSRRSSEAFRAAAGIREKAMKDVPHPALGWDLLGLSYGLHAQGLNEEALKVARRAREVHAASTGKQSGNWTAAQAHAISVLKELAKQAESKSETAAARSHRLESATLQSELADVHLALGERARGEPHLAEAVQTLRQVLGDRDERTLKVVQRLAEWHLDGGDLVNAEAHATELLRLTEATPGADNALRIRALLITTRIHSDHLSNQNLAPQERVRRAEQYQKSAQQSYDLLKPAAGPSLDLAQCLGHLARAAFFRNDTAAQSRLATDAIALHRKLEDTRSLDYSRSLNLLALAEMKEGKLEKAETLLNEVVAVRKQAVGDRHPEYAAAHLNLALLRERQNQFARAAEEYQRALAVYQQRLDAHPGETAMVFRTAGQLSAAFEKAGRSEDAARLWESLAKSRNWPDSLRASLLLQSAGIWKRAHSDMHADYVRLRGLAELALQSATLPPLTPETLEANLADRKRLQSIVEEIHGAKSWQATDARLFVQRAEEWRKLTPSQRVMLAQVADLDRNIEANFALDPHTRLAEARRSLQTRAELQGVGHPDWAGTLNNLAMLLRYVGEFSEAGDCLRQAVEARRTRLGAGHPQTAISLNNLGLVYHDIHNLSQASLCFRQSHAALQAALPPEHEAITDSLNNQSVLRLSMNDNEGGHKLAKECLEHYRRRIALSSDQRNRMLAYPGIRQALSGESNWSGALTSRSYAAPAASSDLVPLGVYLNNLARAEASLNHATAEQTFHDALAQFQKVLADPKLAGIDGLARKEKAVTKTNLALFHLDRGDAEKAEPHLREALEDRRLLVGPKHPDYAASLGTLGYLQYRRKQLADAADSMTRAAEIYRETHGPRSFRYASAIANRAFIHDAAGETEKAFTLLADAIALIHADLQATAATQSEREQLFTIAAQRGYLDHLLALGSRLAKPPEALYGAVLQWKGAVFIRQQQRRERQRLTAANADAARLFRELDDTVRRLGRLTAPATETARNEAAALSKRKEEIERELAALTRVAEEPAATPKALAEALPENVVLVDYIAYRPVNPADPAAGSSRDLSLMAFVVSRSKPVEILDLGPLKPVADAINAWRAGTRREWPLLGKEDPAGVLREKLWLPVEKFLPPTATVLVSPDLALAQLPFAALPGKDPAKYLLEERSVAVIATPQALPKLLREPPKPAAKTAPSILLVGDVDFDAAPGTGSDGKSRSAAPRNTGEPPRWTALAGTRGEMLMIRDSYERKHPFPDGQVAVLRGPRATEESLRRFAPDYRWLHLATHGFFAGEHAPSLLSQNSRTGYSPGVLSGIVLAGANAELDPTRDDGILTAMEVAEIDLSGVEMAILSACETGLGTIAGGEGVLGLQRAFQVAGARSVVSSLWSVDDEATRKLMERFYENALHKPMSRLDALREAQLWLLTEGPKRGMVRLEKKPPAGQLPRTPPYYWAAFALSGDWR